MIDDPFYIAVDLGAGSGRVFLARATPEELAFEEVRRFAHRTGESDGHLRWNFPKILDEIRAGLHEAGARASSRPRDS